MSTFKRDGRMYEPVLQAIAVRQGKDVELCSPVVGAWRGRPAEGTLVLPGSDLGEIEILGKLHRIVAPAKAVGVVTTPASAIRPAEIAVQYGDVMLVLDPEAATAGTDVAAVVGDASTSTEDGLVFPSPLSGRFYARPAPDKPPFVEPGDTIETGRTIALLEVMKTFNRLTYGGTALPPRAKVLAVIPNDGDDIDAGSPLLRIEPA
jgi:acetyl-CoA carboxylase biotin carboxyl carrier protein